MNGSRLQTIRPPIAVEQMSESQLEAHLRSLDDQMKSNALAQARHKSALKNLKRQENKHRSTLLDVCFILFVWYVPSSQLAMAFAMQQSKKKGWEAVVTEDMLADRYMVTPLETLAALESKSGGLPKTVIDQANRFEREYNLYHWVQQANDDKGVAPTTSLVKKHLGTVVHTDTAGGDNVCKAKSKKVSTSWVQRFRKRWVIARGRFAPGERLSLEQVRDKVKKTILFPPASSLDPKKVSLSPPNSTWGAAPWSLNGDPLV